MHYSHTPHPPDESAPTVAMALGGGLPGQRLPSDAPVLDEATREVPVIRPGADDPDDPAPTEPEAQTEALIDARSESDVDADDETGTDPDGVRSDPDVDGDDEEAAAAAEVEVETGHPVDDEDDVFLGEEQLQAELESTADTTTAADAETDVDDETDLEAAVDLDDDGAGDIEPPAEADEPVAETDEPVAETDDPLAVVDEPDPAGDEPAAGDDTQVEAEQELVAGDTGEPAEQAEDVPITEVNVEEEPMIYTAPAEEAEEAGRSMTMADQLSALDGAVTGFAAEAPAAEAPAEVEFAEDERAEVEAAADAPAEETAAPMRPGDLVETPIAMWTADAAQRFREEWRELQVRFIDEPAVAVAEAKNLVTEVVHTLSETLLSEQDEFDPRRNTANPDTEAMRVAMRRYRDFLERVLAL